MTSVLLSSFNWKKTAPKPRSEASTVIKNGCFVFGNVSSSSEMREVFIVRKRRSCSSLQFRGVFSCKRS